MEESMRKVQGESGDKEILYTKAIKAGKRIYYLDVKKNLKNDLFLAITESKKIQPKEGVLSSFEKHKIFLYKEDFDKFIDGLSDVIEFIKKSNEPNTAQKIMSSGKFKNESDDDEIALTIDF
ncbi:DNA-binding protein [Bacteroidia bacterium]|nr:DNA-binding protein [Bacteroidia bacterium]GHU58351.1 DNA-binding protein [Bacteroidia bacterium]